MPRLAHEIHGATSDIEFVTANANEVKNLSVHIQLSAPILDHTAIMAEQLIHRGTLEGHSGWVTSLATSLEK